MGDAWKAAEREVCKFFGVKRRVRVSYDESAGDTTAHPVFSIEVKYGKQVPKYLISKSPVVIVCGKRMYLVCPSDKWDTVDEYLWEHVPRKEVKFLEDALSQARRYNPDKIPTVCVKSPRLKGFVISQEIEHEKKKRVTEKE